VKHTGQESEDELRKIFTFLIVYALKIYKQYLQTASASGRFCPPNPYYLAEA